MGVSRRWKAADATKGAVTADNLNITGYTGLWVYEQSTPDMTLAVASGVAIIGGTKVVYAGGNSGTFTAPGSNNRIDLLCIDVTGTLSIVQGTAAASPTVPTYPPDKLVLAEVYLRTGTTAINQFDAGSHGYINRDARPMSINRTGYLAKSFTPVDTHSTTGEQTLMSASIPANTLGTDNGVEFEIDLTDFDMSNNETVVFRLKYDVTTLATITISEGGGTNFTNLTGFLRGKLMANAATNAQKGVLRAVIGSDVMVASGTDNPYAIAAKAGTSAIDSTTDKNLIVTVQHSANNPSNGVVTDNYTVKRFFS